MASVRLLTWCLLFHSLLQNELKLKSELAIACRQLADVASSKREGEEKNARELNAVRRQLEEKEVC